MRGFLLVLVTVLTLMASSCGAGKNKQAHTTERKTEKFNPAPTTPDTTFNFGLLINDWIGSPYKYGGCSKDGTDCSGMVYTFYKEVFGISLPRSSSELYEKAKKISIEEAKPGDLVFFATKSAKVSHVGMYMMDNKFVHSSTSKGVIISSLDETYYRERLVGFGAYR
ncbi:MAG: C40 family peptidase [Bacteroidia bacterium]